MNTTTETRFSTLADMLKAIRSLSETDFNTFTDLRDYFRYNEDEVKEIIGRENIQTLNRYAYKDKKDRMIKSTYGSIMSAFILCESYVVDVMSGETDEQAKDKIFAAQTSETFEAWKAKRQAEKAEIKKAIENPETLKEFHTFIEYRGEKNLTTEQRER